jgi:DNA-binding transcriptional MerR regulator/methylmalonyl-CoA mutase cobalamin-binding subunit
MAVVTRRTGLSPELIRAWERRYGAVEPARSGGNKRLYSEQDLERLILLRRALESGWQIGQVAALRDEQLRELLGQSGAGPRPEARRPGEAGPGRPDALARCLEAVARLDAPALLAQLEASAAELGRVDLLDDLLVPLFRRIGDECASGTLRIASEHLASAVAARFLESLQGAAPAAERDPGLLVATPAFQHHALGALLVAATARMEGWRTVYLGPNLPAEELAAAARLQRVRAVALSITVPSPDGSLDAELERLGRLLGAGTRLLVGGAAARTCQASLDAVGARRLDDLAGLRAWLRAEGWRGAPEP